jgi:ATP-dependent Clp protease ATP-binding subunit ClpB
VPLFLQILNSEIQSFLKSLVAKLLSRTNSTLNEAESIAKKMNDEFVSIEHLILAILVLKVELRKS